MILLNSYKLNCLIQLRSNVLNISWGNKIVSFKYTAECFSHFSGQNWCCFLTFYFTLILELKRNVQNTAPYKAHYSKWHLVCITTRAWKPQPARMGVWQSSLCLWTGGGHTADQSRLKSRLRDSRNNSQGVSAGAELFLGDWKITKNNSN